MKDERQVLSKNEHLLKDSKNIYNIRNYGKILFDEKGVIRIQEYEKDTTRNYWKEDIGHLNCEQLASLKCELLHNLKKVMSTTFLKTVVFFFFFVSLKSQNLTQ